MEEGLLDFEIWSWANTPHKEPPSDFIMDVPNFYFEDFENSCLESYKELIDRREFYMFSVSTDSEYVEFCDCGDGEKGGL